MSRASQALPPAPSTVPEKPLTPETLAPNQSKNMKMKRRTAEIAEIFSPLLSLSSSICSLPPESSGTGRIRTLHPRAGGGQRVDEQHRDRHRADAAGHRRDRRGDLAPPPRSRRRRTRPSSVRFMPTSITTAPGLTVSAPSSFGTADGGDQHVGAAADGGEVAGARVADGDGRVRGEQQPRDRLADEVRAADDDRLGALELDPAGARAAPSPRPACTGRRPGVPVGEQPGVDRGEAVDVLGRVDRADHRVRVDLRRAAAAARGSRRPRRRR